MARHPDATTACARSDDARAARRRLPSGESRVGLPSESLPQPQVRAMVRWVPLFLVLALIAGLLGFTNVAGGAAGVARIAFWLFLVLVLIGLVAGLARGPSQRA